jgi:hypothetical protein
MNRSEKYERSCLLCTQRLFAVGVTKNRSTLLLFARTLFSVDIICVIYVWTDDIASSLEGWIITTKSLVLLEESGDFLAMKSNFEKTSPVIPYQGHLKRISRRPEQTGAQVLQVLEAEPWSSVRMVAVFLNIPATTVHLHLTTSLNMKSRHFKGFPISSMMA